MCMCIHIFVYIRLYSTAYCTVLRKVLYGKAVLCKNTNMCAWIDAETVICVQEVMLLSNKSYVRLVERLLGVIYEHQNETIVVYKKQAHLSFSKCFQYVFASSMNKPILHNKSAFVLHEQPAEAVFAFD